MAVGTSKAARVEITEELSILFSRHSDIMADINEMPEDGGVAAMFRKAATEAMFEVVHRIIRTPPPLICYA